MVHLQRLKGMQRGTFSDKNGILKGNGLDLGVEPTRMFFCFFFSTPWVSNFFLLGKKISINQLIKKESLKSKYLLSSFVSSTFGTLATPTPLRVKAATLILYLVNLPSSVRVTFLASEPLTVLLKIFSGLLMMK